MTQPLLKLDHLRTRPEFLAAAKALFVSRGAVGVQARPRSDADITVRIGFTATRKVGGAVVRNRAKRRLREAARALLPLYGRPGCDYVLIARGGTPSRPWPRLLDDVKNALISLATQLDAQSSAAAASEPPAPTPPPAG